MVNPHAKFEVCIFSRPRDIKGSQNLKSRSRDQGHAPFWPIFHVFGLAFLTVNAHAKYEICIFSRPRDCMPFGVLSGVPDVITHAKFYVNRLTGFSGAAPPNVPIPILMRTTLTTVRHYRAL